ASLLRLFCDTWQAVRTLPVLRKEDSLITTRRWWLAPSSQADRIGGAFVARFSPDQLRALRSDPRSDVQAHGLPPSGRAPAHGKGLAKSVDATCRCFASHLSFCQGLRRKYSRDRFLHRWLYDCRRIRRPRLKHAEKDCYHRSWRAIETPPTTEQEYHQRSKKEPGPLRRA